MELAPRLIEVATPEDAVGDVLVLHGGGSRRNMMVSPTQLSVLRMVPIARQIARAGRGRLGVYRLLNTKRGWDTTHTPVDDARWALAEMAERGGERPVCLVGHSLGGRAAILTSTEPRVAGAVALAPWVFPSDVPAGLDGQRILIVHGSRDRIASAPRALALAERLASRTPTRFELVEGAGHAMLRHHGRFSGAAADFAVETLRESRA